MATVPRTTRVLGLKALQPRSLRCEMVVVDLRWADLDSLPPGSAEGRNYSGVKDTELRASAGMGLPISGVHFQTATRVSLPQATRSLQASPC